MTSCAVCEVAMMRGSGRRAEALELPWDVCKAAELAHAGRGEAKCVEQICASACHVSENCGSECALGTLTVRFC